MEQQLDVIREMIQKKIPDKKGEEHLVYNDRYSK